MRLLFERWLVWNILGRSLIAKILVTFGPSFDKFFPSVYQLAGTGDDEINVLEVARMVPLGARQVWDILGLTT